MPFVVLLIANNAMSSVTNYATPIPPWASAARFCAEIILWRGKPSCPALTLENSGANSLTQSTTHVEAES